METIWKNAVVYWPAAHTSFGDIPEFSIEVPPHMNGRLDIWKIPPCESHPDGYWFTLNSGGNNTAEPGCAAWEKVLLAQVRFSSAPTGEETETHSGFQGNVVEYVHPEVPLNDSQLNPNDYSSITNPEESETQPVEGE